MWPHSVGISAAYLGMGEKAYNRLKVMTVKRLMNPSLSTSHEPKAGIFNTDGNGGIPQVVNTMLVFSRLGRLDLLPALTGEWPKVEIDGILAYGQITLICWAWDGSDRGARLSLTSRSERTIKVCLDGNEQ